VEEQLSVKTRESSKKEFML